MTMPLMTMMTLMALVTLMTPMTPTTLMMLMMMPHSLRPELFHTGLSGLLLGGSICS